MPFYLNGIVSVEEPNESNGQNDRVFLVWVESECDRQRSRFRRLLPIRSLCFCLYDFGFVFSVRRGHHVEELNRFLFQTLNLAHLKSFFFYFVCGKRRRSTSATLALSFPSSLFFFLIWIPQTRFSAIRWNSTIQSYGSSGFCSLLWPLLLGALQSSPQVNKIQKNRISLSLFWFWKYVFSCFGIGLVVHWLILAFLICLL